MLGDISLHSSSRVCASHGLPKSVFVEFKWCSGILDIAVKKGMCMKFGLGGTELIYMT